MASMTVTRITNQTGNFLGLQIELRWVQGGQAGGAGLGP